MIDCLYCLTQKKLIPAEDQSLFEEEIVEVHDEGEKLEVIKKISGIGGEMTVTEVIDPVKFYEQKGIGKDDPKYILIEEITNFMNAVSQGDYEQADKIMNNIIQKKVRVIYSKKLEKLQGNFMTH